MRGTILFCISLSVAISFSASNGGARTDCELILSQQGEQFEASLAARHFAMFVTLPSDFSKSESWTTLIRGVLRNDPASVLSAYSNLPLGNRDRALRLLYLAQEDGFEIPADLQQSVTRESRKIKLRREKTYRFHGLSTIEQRDLTYALILVGIRRSKLERVWEKTRASVGLKSRDLVPIIPAHRAENAVGDAARALVESYEHAISAHPQQRVAHFQILLRDLFDLYLKRQFQVTRDPWFKVNGIDLNLVNFVNTGAYQQPVPKAENTWMHLITLTPDRVQNPQLKGYSRELWWNRDRGINPLGTVRLSRNSVKQPDGTDQTLSVEVLRKTAISSLLFLSAIHKAICMNQTVHGP